MPGKSKLAKLRALNQNFRGGKGDRRKSELAKQSRELGPDPVPHAGVMAASAAPPVVIAAPPVAQAALWPAAIDCFENTAQGDCAVLGVEHWISDPCHVVRRWDCGTPYYHKVAAAEHEEMLNFRRRMSRGFMSLGEAERATIVTGLLEDLAPGKQNDEGVCELFEEAGKYVGDPGFRCLSLDLQHPILVISPNFNTKVWWHHLYGYAENPDADCIGLLFNGLTDERGHTMSLSDVWLREHAEAAGLGHVNFRAPGKKWTTKNQVTVQLNDFLDNPVLKRPAGPAIPPVMARPVGAGVKANIAADGSNAVIVDPVVPRKSNRKADLQPPNRKQGSLGEHLTAERFWWIDEKAVLEPWGRLRSITLTDAGAKHYWDSIMLLVACVDQAHALTLTPEERNNPLLQHKHTTLFENLQVGYLAIFNIRKWFVDHIAGTLQKNGQARKKSYFDTLKRRLNAMAYAFVWPKLETDDQWNRYMADLNNIRTDAGTAALAIQPRTGPAGSAWVVDPSMAAGGYYVAPPKANWHTMMGNIALKEKVVGGCEYELALLMSRRGKKSRRLNRSGASADDLQKEIDKAERLLALAKQDLLVGYLELWDCDRSSDLRKLVVNWDIGEVLTPSGSMELHMFPQTSKTQWRQEAAIGGGTEVGKVQHQRIYDLYKDFLRRHRPILIKDMGLHGTHHKKWSDVQDGVGADKLVTLFPGFWDDSQQSRFNQCIFRALGCGEIRCRRILNTEFMKHRKQYRILRQAVDQSLHHSAEMTDRVYLAGQRNLLNPMQAELFGW